MRQALRTAVVTSTALAVLGSAAALLPAALTPAAQAGPAGPVRTATRVVVDQSYPVPGSGRYTVSGHGYGHGRGMSQHGAQGAALRGWSHERILGFYYPGTELSQARNRLRVLITADTTPGLLVEAAAGLRVRDHGNGRTYRLPTNLRADRWRIEVDAQNRNIVEYEAGGTWRRWSPGERETLVGEGQFRADEPISLVLPSGARVTYRGWLRASAPSEGSRDRDTVNALPLNAYVRGVVASEMPALWSPEAVQSQSVAARTYAAWHRSRNPERYYHLCDTTACQVYGGVDREHPASDAAVEATSRQILTWQGDPAFTEFSASSGGWTVASSVPYQVAQEDPHDDWSGNANHDWTTTLTARQIESAYPGIGALRRLRVTARDGNGQWQGRVLEIRLVGRRSTAVLSGDTFRSRFGLRSTWISF